MPDFAIYGFHALFYGMFLPRLLGRRARRAAAGRTPPAAGGAAAVILAAFGDRYREYASRVKRFVPGVY